VQTNDEDDDVVVVSGGGVIELIISCRMLIIFSASWRRCGFTCSCCCIGVRTFNHLTFNHARQSIMVMTVATVTVY